MRLPYASGQPEEAWASALSLRGCSALYIRYVSYTYAIHTLRKLYILSAVAGEATYTTYTLRMLTYADVR